MSLDSLQCKTSLYKKGQRSLCSGLPVLLSYSSLSHFEDFSPSFCLLYSVLPLLPCSVAVSALPSGPPASFPAPSIGMFSPPQAPREVVLLPGTFPLNSFGCLCISEFAHGLGVQCLQLHPLWRVCKKPQCPSSVQKGPCCLLFIIFGLCPHQPSHGLTSSACSGFSGWMKHPPKENPGTCAHACIHTRVQCYPAAALALCAGSRIPFIAEFPFSCCPEGASSSCVSGQGSSIPHQLRGKNSIYCMYRKWPVHSLVD